MRLIRAFRDCKQRSLSVSKEALTVSKKASSVFNTAVSFGEGLQMSSGYPKGPFCTKISAENKFATRRNIATAIAKTLRRVRRHACFCSKVPEGHHPRGTTLHEALRANLPLRGLCGALRGLSEGSAGLCGGLRDFPRFFGGSDPMLVTLGNCWIF